MMEKYMRRVRSSSLLRQVIAFGILLSVGAVSAQQPDAFKPEAGFTSLFDGKTLDGWQMINQRGEGYGAKDGVLFCAKGGGGKLLTTRNTAISCCASSS